MDAVTVLFADANSVYKTLQVDVWDRQRDATRWPGGTPVIAHPPCAEWSRLRRQALPREKHLAPWALEQIRKWGGVLEHPESSTLWPEYKLPSPGQHDKHGWTLAIQQHDWGHRCRKNTFLYIVGPQPRDLPPVPLNLGEPETTIDRLHSSHRSATPRQLALWLIELCRAITR